MEITFTCTTSRRIRLFFNMMESFLNCCEDKDMITRWIVSDDRSSEKDINNMKKAFPFLEIVRPDKNGQAASLNKLFSCVKTDWIFHSEDDWVFLRRDKIITKCLEIHKDDDRIRNIILTNWRGVKVNSGNLEYIIHYHHPSLIKEVARTCDARWLGYSLNPGLQHLKTIKKYGEYNLNFKQNSRFWDRLLAFRYLKDGYKRASLIGNYVMHTGGRCTLY